jgi:hypothetical protein
MFAARPRALQRISRGPADYASGKTASASKRSSADPPNGRGGEVNLPPAGFDRLFGVPSLHCRKTGVPSDLTLFRSLSGWRV